MEKGPPGAVVAAASALARFASSETDEDPVCAGSAIDTKVAIADWTRLWRKSHAGKREGEGRGVREWRGDGVLELGFSPPLHYSITPTLQVSATPQLVVRTVGLGEDGLPLLRVNPGTNARIAGRVGPRVDAFQHFARAALAHFNSGVFDEALFRPMQKLQAKVSQPKI